MGKKNKAIFVFIALLLIAGSTGAFTLNEKETLSFLDDIKITLRSANQGKYNPSTDTQSFDNATFSVSKGSVTLNCQGIGSDLYRARYMGPSEVGWCYLNNEKLVGIILTNASGASAAFEVVYKDRAFKNNDDMAVYAAAAKKTAEAIGKIGSAARPAGPVTGLKAIIKKQGETISFSDLKLTMASVSSYSAKFKVVRGKDNELDCSPSLLSFGREETLYKGGEAVCVDTTIGDAEILKVRLVDLIEGKAYLQILYPVVNGKLWDAEEELLKAYPYAPDSSIPDVAYLVRQGTSIIQESGGKFALHEKAPFYVVLDNLLSGNAIFFGSKEALDKFIYAWKEEAQVQDITQDQRFFSELNKKAEQNPYLNSYVNFTIPQNAGEVKFGKIESSETALECARNEPGRLECKTMITQVNGKDVKDSELSEITLVVLIDWDGNGKLDKAKEYKEMKIDFESAIGKGYVVLEPTNLMQIGSAGYKNLDDYAKKLVVKKDAAIIAQYKDNALAGQGRIFAIGGKYIVINGLEQNTNYDLFHGAMKGSIKVGADDPDLIVGECNERQAVKGKDVGGKTVLYCE